MKKNGWVVIGTRNGKSFPCVVHTNKNGLQKALETAQEYKKKNRDVDYCVMSVVVE